MNITRIAGIVTITVALLWVGACTNVGDTQTESRSVALGSAGAARVAIDMGAGRLAVGGGARELMDAEFTYNVAKWKPEVTYSVNGGQGNLAVRQPAGKGVRPALGDTRNEWDLRLNNQVPTELHVNLGAGTSTLKLGGLPLTGLDVEMGAGDTTIDLTGDWKRDLDARIEGGAGKVTVRIPRAVGVRVAVDNGVGKVEAGGLTRDGDAYMNEAYGRSAVTLRIKLEHGAGKVNLELAG